MKDGPRKLRVIYCDLVTSAGGRFVTVCPVRGARLSCCIKWSGVIQFHFCWSLYVRFVFIADIGSR